MAETTLSHRGNGISWKVWLVLLILSVIGLLLLAQAIPFTADGGNGGQNPCPQVTPALEASVSLGLSYFESGGVFAGLSPVTITLDQMAQRLFQLDYGDLSNVSKRVVIEYNLRVGDMKARHTEYLAGYCWTFRDATIMGRILDLFR